MVADAWWAAGWGKGSVALQSMALLAEHLGFIIVLSTVFMAGVIAGASLIMHWGCDLHGSHEGSTGSSDLSAVTRIVYHHSLAIKDSALQRVGAAWDAGRWVAWLATDGAYVISLPTILLWVLKVVMSLRPLTRWARGLR